MVLGVRRRSYLLLTLSLWFLVRSVISYEENIQTSDQMVHLGDCTTWSDVPRGY